MDDFKITREQVQENYDLAIRLAREEEDIAIKKARDDYKAAVRAAGQVYDREMAYVMRRETA